MLDRLALCDVERVFVFSHGQFIRAVAWLVMHGTSAGEPDQMHEFSRLDTQVPLANCAGYELTLKDGRWVVDYQVGPEGVRFIDQFCTDQSVLPVPHAPSTAEIREGMRHLKKLFT